MLSVSKYVRNAYLMALDNDILYNGEYLKIYNNYPFQRILPTNYIQIRDVFDTNVENDSKFIREVLVELEIYCQQYSVERVDSAEDIADLVLDRLMNKIGGTNISISALDFGHVYLEDNRTLFEVDDKGYYITRKILTFRQLVTIKTS